jgi:hypothetical protein
MVDGDWSTIVIEAEGVGLTGDLQILDAGVNLVSRGNVFVFKFLYR